jgi:hypothetical protein
MDWQTMFNLAAGGFGILGGIMLRETWSAISTMRADLQALQASIAATYVRRDDFRDFSQRVLDKLESIEAKVDHKVDR